ncbi:hypothetical protein M3175_01495 [Robertmurraya korlensis]|uniref:hypothetical protein n=1 Tax=Robertmurraya korlensis TaxID=519977 RepID=UPI00203C49B0|nr:hypothetical protein [Robertmurraya korlensis]MCM3599389.1 hypothetical protein [Robertmurraya korlensis]
MNPGKLNKRLLFSFGMVWGQRVIKTKRRDFEQNEESYQFIIRKDSDVAEYQTFTCDGLTYLILTFEEVPKGYLTLNCEKARKHSFYDSCNVSRMVNYKTDSGATRERLEVVLSQIPCELIRLVSGSANESEQERDVIYRFELHLENEHVLKAGDQLEITHKLDVYKATVQSYFRTHTHQTVELLMEDEA